MVWDICTLLIVDVIEFVVEEILVIENYIDLIDEIWFVMEIVVENGDY